MWNRTEAQETSIMISLKASWLLFSTQDFQLSRQENEFFHGSSHLQLFNEKVTFLQCDLLAVTVLLENTTISSPEKKSITHNILLFFKMSSVCVYTVKSQVDIELTWFIELIFRWPEKMPYFARYYALPCILCTHVFGPSFQKNPFVLIF